MTGALHFQVHPYAVQELFIDPLPEDMSHEGVLYPDGAHLMDLEVCDLLYKMQRPAIASSLCLLLDTLLSLMCEPKLVRIPTWLEGKGCRAIS